MYRTALFSLPCHSIKCQIRLRLFRGEKCQLATVSSTWRHRVCAAEHPTRPETWRNVIQQWRE